MLAKKEGMELPFKIGQSDDQCALGRYTCIEDGDTDHRHEKINCLLATRTNCMWAMWKFQMLPHFDGGEVAGPLHNDDSFWVCIQSHFESIIFKERFGSLHHQ